MEAGAHSYGHERKICDVDGFRLAETYIHSGLHIGEHSHEPGQIVYVLEGHYREQIGNDDILLGPGRLMAHEPGERHSNQFTFDGDVLALLISVDLRRWIRFEGPRPVRTNALLDDLAREIRGEMRHGDDAARTALEGLGLMALSRLARLKAPDRREPEWLSDAVSIVERRYCDALSLATVARAVGVHRTTLAVAYRRFRQKSVGEHIRDVRVMHARHALINSEAPLVEIALMTGFHDQAHFTRTFRTITGFAPGEYRTRHKP
jgi:AraC family transcriptional regulator